MSKLDQITAFIDVVEENGFAAAARKQGISTPAISRQINHLETTLGTQLLFRTTRQISLTEIGSKYYHHCKKMLAELTQAEEEILGSQKEALGVLNLTCSPYYAYRSIIPRLPEFQAQNPKLRIKLEIAERIANFNEEDVDILYGISAEAAPELIRKRIATTRYVVCAAPSYLKKFGTPISPNDLFKHKYITHSIRKPFDMLKFKNHEEIYLEPAFSINDTTAMRDCAVLGMGIIKVHDCVIEEELRDGRLVELLVDYQAPSFSVYLYYQQNRFLQPKIRRFIDFYCDNN